MSVFPEGNPEFDLEYAREAAAIDAAELINTALDHAGLNAADLARMLQVSRSEVSSRLSGTRNITVRKLAESLHMLGAKLELNIVFQNDSTTARN